MVAETLMRQNITPFYFQANFSLVPNCTFDFVLYDDRCPVVLSVKVSLRERYKQADLEGNALRQVYRQAKQYLLTLNDSEAKANKPKIESGDISGLAGIIVACKPEYDSLLKELAVKNFIYAQQIVPILGKVFPKENT